LGGLQTEPEFVGPGGVITGWVPRNVFPVQKCCPRYLKVSFGPYGVDYYGSEFIPRAVVNIKAEYSEGINESWEDCRCECCEYWQILVVTWTLRRIDGSIINSGREVHDERESAEEERNRTKDSDERPCWFQHKDEPGHGVLYSPDFSYSLKVEGESRITGSGGQCGSEIAASCQWSVSAEYIVTAGTDRAHDPYHWALTRLPEEEPCIWVAE
jgi:hypothetical protein